MISDFTLSDIGKKGIAEGLIKLKIQLVAAPQHREVAALVSRTGVQKCSIPPIINCGILPTPPQTSLWEETNLQLIAA